MKRLSRDNIEIIANRVFETYKALPDIKNSECYCGSHNCASFYVTNEWGYTEYTPTKCPDYSKQKDKTEVCPRCGRAYWSQSNPTGCFSFL